MLKMQDGRPLIVTEPVMRPNVCALSPQTARDPEGFIDTGTKLPGVSPRVYLAMGSVRDLVRSLGWPTEAERDDLVARVAELEAERDRLRAELAEAVRSLEAVAVLKQAGYSASRKPGRPAAVKGEKAAAA